MRVANTADTARHSQSGFTLVELLVVIAIIGILVGLLLPAVQAAREAARRSQCLNNMRQLALGCHNYESTNGFFPPAAGLGPYSHVAEVLPFIEQPALHDSINFDMRWDQSVNEGIRLVELASVKCPSQKARESVGLNNSNVEELPIRNHYFAVTGAKANDECPLPSGSPLPYTVGGCEKNGERRGGNTTNGIMYAHSETKVAQITDGTSQTFLLGELSWDYAPDGRGPAGNVDVRGWYVGHANKTAISRATAKKRLSNNGVGTRLYNAMHILHPINSVGFSPVLVNGQPVQLPARLHEASFGSKHPGGCHFALADGSANFVSENTDIHVLKLLACRFDGRIIQEGL